MAPGTFSEKLHTEYEGSGLKDFRELKEPLCKFLSRSPHMNLTGKVRITTIVASHGGCSDVFRGVLEINGEECPVAVKKLRAHVVEVPKLQKVSCRTVTPTVELW